MLIFNNTTILFIINDLQNFYKFKVKFLSQNKIFLNI